MENFYKITKAEADLIGKFEYAPNQAVDPFCGEQVDGNYLISEKMYLILKDHPKLQNVDFSKKQLVGKDFLNTKPTEI